MTDVFRAEAITTDAVDTAARRLTITLQDDAGQETTLSI